ncbi:MAG: serine protease [Thermoplasmata archaeon]|nr:MAG: serine protease [Thermoplasmata archaeon]
MPTWGGILEELKKLREKGTPIPFDLIRRKYLRRLNRYTKRNVVIYMSQWSQPGANDPENISINEEDIQGLMEVVHGLKGTKLDLIIHSPGGSAEATEAMVNYLRTKFTDIRVIIPQAAMSAATMLACCADEIVMGKHSSLGPIDPQMLVYTQFGPKYVPAEAILDQFDLAKKECKDPENLGTWMPILSQYGPALLIECRNAQDLSISLVSEWLERYMFKNEANSKKNAEEIALYLSAHREFKSHGRHICREKARDSIGLKITNLEDDQVFQDLVLSVFHATTHTFSGTPAVKIIENHNGKAFVKIERNIVFQVPQPLKEQVDDGKLSRMKKDIN